MKFPLALLAGLVLLSCSEQQAPPKPATTRVDAKRQQQPLTKQAANPYAAVDLSPMDISYFPVDYPKLKMADSLRTPPVARVIYSRPQKQGRELFGSLIKYGEPWRMGANEATEIEFFRNVTIQGKRVNKGRYVLYCVPQRTEWTIIFNSNVDSWGLDYEASKDVHRFVIPTGNSNVPVEFFTIVFQHTQSGPDLLMAWGNTVARLPIQL
jgi:hypothetical protein